MSATTSNITLNPEALELFKIISQYGRINVEKLTTISTFNRGKVEFLISHLVEKGLVKRNDKIEERYVLTETGKQAAVHGLIERRILDLVKKEDKFSIQKLNERLKSVDKKEINVGIGLLKRANVIAISKGIISVLKPDMDFNFELQSCLEELSKGKTIINDKCARELLKRGLVRKEETKIIELEAVKKYEEVKERIHIIEGITKLTPSLLRTGEWRKKSFKDYNLSVSPPIYYSGRKQPYAQFIDEVKQKLVAMGFREMRGPIVELEFWNFDALFQAQDHPARKRSDVYRIAFPTEGKLPKAEYVSNVKAAHENGYNTGSKGWQYKWDPKKAARLILRAQGTSVSARTLVGLKIPSKYFSISRCYRPDEVDATHLSEFNQVEGIVADPSLTFRDLLGILETFALDIAGAEECVFKPDYYPFTEPSVELSVKDPVLGRVEFGGAGIFRPEVTKPFGIDVPVIAWGLGIDRLFMVKYGIKDIRELFSHKLSWLRTAKMI